MTQTPSEDVSTGDMPETEASKAQAAVHRGEVLGVLTGQVPVPKSMPVVLRTKPCGDCAGEGDTCCHVGEPM